MTPGYSCIGPDDEPRLRDEHAFLSRQLDEVIRLAQAGDLRGSETLWESFSRELEEHLQYEENLLFPTFAQTGSPQALCVECFRVEHEEIRSQCHAICGESAEGPFHIDPLRQLAAKLHEHREGEAAIVCPWLASLAAPASPWGRMRFAVRPAAGSSRTSHSRA